MSYEEIKSRLKEELSHKKSSSITLPTLGGQAKVSFSISENGEHITVTNSNGTNFTIDEPAFDAVYHRYHKLEEEERLRTGNYNDPKWPESPNRIIAPYIPVLIRHYQG